MISVSKKALPKIPNDQLSSQISKRQTIYLFNKRLVILTFCKNITHYIQIYQFCVNLSQKLLRLTMFTWKSPKTYLTCWKTPKIFPPPSSMLCQVWESYARLWWPGMTKKTCNHHWIRRAGYKSHFYSNWLYDCSSALHLERWTRYFRNRHSITFSKNKNFKGY